MNTLVGLFKNHVSKSPSSPAVQFEDGPNSISYLELDVRSKLISDKLLQDYLKGNDEVMMPLTYVYRGITLIF